MPDPSFDVRLGWFATDLDEDGHVPADMVPYDNGASGLAATDAQAAIDELALVGPTATGGFVPTFVAAGTTFVVPDNRQALFVIPIVLGAGAGISIGSNSALVEVG